VVEHPTTPHERSTQPAPARLGHALIAALFLLCTAGLGLYDAVAWRTIGLRQAQHIAPVPWSRDALQRGGSARAIESALEDGSHAAARLRPFAHDAQLVLLGMARPGVELGRDGWLFLSGDVEHDRSAPERQRIAAAWMAAATLPLRARGIECVVLVVPDKATAYPERRPAWASPPRDDYPHGLRMLEAAGLPAPDVSSWMRAQPDVLFYCPDDTHWTLEAAARSADWLAHRLLERAPQLGPALGTGKFAGNWQAPHYLGDHLRQLGTSQHAPWTRALRVSEFNALVHLERQVPPAECELQLVGTSMSARQLRQQLARALGAAVGDFVQAGGTVGGQFARLLELVASGGAERTRIVLWEIVERYQRSVAAEHFRGVGTAIANAWSPAWREIATLPETRPELRELACLLATPPEGAPQVWEPETWRTASYELDWLLPGNGTFALRLGARELGEPTAEAPFPAQRALLAPRLPLSGRCVEPVRAAVELAPPLPLVAPAHTSSMDLALVGAPDSSWQPRLLSAWQELRELSLPAPSSSLAAGNASSAHELEIELGDELRWDGLHALVLELGPTRAGELEWQAPDAPATAQRAQLAARARLTCVLPLAASAANGAHARSALVRVRHTAASGAEPLRVLRAELWRLPELAGSAR
jgi:hypothetical protein